VVDGELGPVAPVAETARALSAPELVASDPAEIATAEIATAGIATAGIATAEAPPAEAGRPVGLVRAAR
jgi:hypothetical protein